MVLWADTIIGTKLNWPSQQKRNLSKKKKGEIKIFTNPIVLEFQMHKWTMEPAALKAFFERLARLPAEATSFSVTTAQQPKRLEVVDDMAIISISGVLLKTVPGWMRKWGIEATGYDEIRAQIKEALADKYVNRIHLQVDSPGGMIAGQMEAVDAIFNARSVKPVTATIEDLGASGAYWLTSQAETIEAGRNALVGSIGVFTIYTDYSEANSKAGIKVIVIRSGEHKGMGIDKVTDNQIAAVQKVIDAITENFIDSVARGRRQSKLRVREWATGQLWIATKAQELGLIDTIVRNQTLTKTGSVRRGEATKEQTIEQMREQVRAEERKRLDELKAAFAADDFEFFLDAFERGWSGERARAEYMKTTNECVQEVAGAKATKDSDTSEEKKLIEKIQGQERQRFRTLLDAFDFDQTFAIEAWKKGWTVEQAAGFYYEPQEPVRKVARTNVIACADSDSGDQIQGDFIMVGKALAQAEGIKLELLLSGWPENSQSCTGRIRKNAMVEKFEVPESEKRG